jgi:hypothetical protein
VASDLQTRPSALSKEEGQVMSYSDLQGVALCVAVALVGVIILACKVGQLERRVDELEKREKP